MLFLPARSLLVPLPKSPFLPTSHLGNALRLGSAVTAKKPCLKPRAGESARLLGSDSSSSWLISTQPLTICYHICPLYEIGSVSPVPGTRQVSVTIG